MGSVILVLLLLVVYLLMATLGSVLLAAFFISNASHSERMWAAAFGGPAALLLPTGAFAVFDSRADTVSVVIGLGVMGVMMFLAVGWPVAHFATKRLDKLTQFDLETFE
jgi:hypothetical protein